MSVHNDDQTLTPPLLLGGSSGSTISLNWICPPLEPGGWYELDIMETGERIRLCTNGYSTLYNTDGEKTFRVTVYDARGNHATSNDVSVVVDITTPATPEVSLSSHGIVVTLSWESIPMAVMYEILCNGDPVGNAYGPPFEKTEIRFNHHVWHDGVYNYEVRACDEKGRWSPFSAPVTHIVDTLPPDPPKVEVAVRGLQVRVQWRALSEKPMTYYVRCNGEDVGTTDRTFFDTSVSSAGSYSYRVQAEDTEGRQSEWSAITDFSTVFIGRRSTWRNSM